MYQYQAPIIFNSVFENLNHKYPTQFWKSKGKKIQSYSILLGKTKTKLVERDNEQKHF